MFSNIENSLHSGPRLTQGLNCLVVLWYYDVSAIKNPISGKQQGIGSVRKTSLQLRHDSMFSLFAQK